MLKYRGSHLPRAGVIGVVVIILTIAVGLQPERLLSWATDVRYHALFAEAGGLAPGNDVSVSGTKVGLVQDISLQRGKALVTFTVDGRVPLGSQTTAHIRTGSLLGKRKLTLESDGQEALRPLSTIPLSQTSSPYSLTDAVGELTTNVAGTDTQMLNQSLDMLSTTIDQVAPQLGPTFDGLSRLSQSLNNRNGLLGDLLKGASDVSGVLSEQSRRINALILNANDLLEVFNDRRHAIIELLANVSAVAKQLTGMVHDNERELAPALEKLNAVAAMLEKNRDDIGAALAGLAKFSITQGEIVASGSIYNAFVPNMSMPPMLQPFLDYAFGFRRGVNAGQPPDNVGPRAEFPFPVNGIPEIPLTAIPGGSREPPRASRDHRGEPDRNADRCRRRRGSAVVLRPQVDHGDLQHCLRDLSR
ncbi:MCE family protein [Mycolicibacterium holsaticum]|uniref:MCE family protein n=1 Tax=Mycolicibacterium holsaticum TaxID=152142 RepID=UPI00223E316C|nr:MCE family protein [Mycolicibacterium holsaticum]